MGRVFKAEVFACSVEADAAGRIWLTTIGQDAFWRYPSAALDRLPTAGRFWWP